MSIPGKTRSVARRGFRVQRRIAITQALVWPVVLGTGVIVGTVALLSIGLGHRRSSATAVDPVPDGKAASA